MQRARLWVGALVLAARLVSAAPDHLAAGREAKQAGRLTEAAAELRQAVAAEPANAEAHWYLAWVLVALHETPGAVNAFRRVVALAPGTPRATEAGAAIARLQPAPPPNSPTRRPEPALALLRGSVESVQTGSGQVLLRVLALGAGVAPPPPAGGRVTLLLGTFGRGPRRLGLARNDAPLSLLKPGDTLEVGLGPRVQRVWSLRSLARVDASGRPQPWSVLAGQRALRYGEQATDANVLVPLTFPVLGGATWHDTFLSPRGGGRHLGQDLCAPRMRPLVAAFDGTVHLIHATADHPANTLVLVGDNGWQAIYTHLNDDTPGTQDHARNPAHAFAAGLEEGARVAQGEVVGWCGTSGDATGPHLHLELRDNATGRVHNSRDSLKAGELLTTPRLAAVAAQLRPGAGQVRLDGYLAQFDLVRRVAVLAVRARADAAGTAPITQPMRRYVRCEQVPARVLGADGLSVPPESLMPGAYLIVLGRADGESLVASAVYGEVVGLAADGEAAERLSALPGLGAP